MVVHEVIKDGFLDRHIPKIRTLYGDQCQCMLAAMAEHFPAAVQWTKPEGGMFIWVTLPKHIDAMKLLDEAIANKVAFVPGSPFYANEPETNTLRLSFVTVSPERIRAGIAIRSEAAGRGDRQQGGLRAGFAVLRQRAGNEHAAPVLRDGVAGTHPRRHRHPRQADRRQDLSVGTPVRPAWAQRRPRIPAAAEAKIQQPLYPRQHHLPCCVKALSLKVTKIPESNTNPRQLVCKRVESAWQRALPRQNGAFFFTIRRGKAVLFERIVTFQLGQPLYARANIIVDRTPVSAAPASRFASRGRSTTLAHGQRLREGEPQ